MTTTPMTSNVVPADDDLVERLRKPTGWSCVFKHNGQMRHGTTDAPFKAADRIASLSSELARCRNALEEARSFVVARTSRPEGFHEFRRQMLISEIDAALNPIGERE